MRFLSENNCLVLDTEVRTNEKGIRKYYYDIYFGKAEIITFNSDIDLKLKPQTTYRLLLGITPKTYNGSKYNAYTIEKVIHD